VSTPGVNPFSAAYDNAGGFPGVVAIGATAAAKNLPISATVVSDGAGGLTFVDTAYLKDLDNYGNGITALGAAFSIGSDLTDPTTTYKKIGTDTAKAAGCAVLNDSTYGLGCPTFVLVYTSSNMFFGPTGPGNYVINGIHIGNTKIFPGASDVAFGITNAWSSVWH
jgi:hypothetical protein